MDGADVTRDVRESQVTRARRVAMLGMRGSSVLGSALSVQRGRQCKTAFKVEGVTLTMPSVVDLGVEEMKERRSLALASVKMSEKRLRRLAAKYQLNAQQLAVMDLVDDLDFLIGPHTA